MVFFKNWSWILLFIFLRVNFVSYVNCLLLFGNIFFYFLYLYIVNGFMDMLVYVWLVGIKLKIFLFFVIVLVNLVVFSDMKLLWRFNVVIRWFWFWIKVWNLLNFNVWVIFFGIIINRNGLYFLVFFFMVLNEYFVVLGLWFERIMVNVFLILVMFLMYFDSCLLICFICVFVILCFVFKWVYVSSFVFFFVVLILL